MKLSSDFEDQVREAVLDDAQEQLEDRLADQAVEAAHDRLREVASRNDYDIENVIDSLEGPEVSRDGNTITVEFRWTHEAAALFGYGTDDHFVEGNPVLAFEYPVAEGGPGGVVFSTGHEVSGIEESRFVRHGLRWLRNELEDG